MKRPAIWFAFVLTALALPQTARAGKGLQPNQAPLTNVTGAGDQDFSASGVAALTDLTYHSTTTLYSPRGKPVVFNIYGATLTVTADGLTPGAYYVVQCQYTVVYGWYQVVPMVEVTADASGNISQTFDILVFSTKSDVENIQAGVSRDEGIPQPYPWQDTLTPVLQGWVEAKGK